MIDTMEDVGAPNGHYVIYGGNGNAAKVILLNYQDATVKSGNTDLICGAGIGTEAKVFAFGDGIKLYSTDYYSFNFANKNYAFNASKIEILSIVFNAEATDITEKVKVYANFNDETQPQLLEHSWLVDFKPGDITGPGTSVTVNFLGKDYTGVQVTEAGSGGGESE